MGPAVGFKKGLDPLCMKAGVLRRTKFHSTTRSVSQTLTRFLERGSTMPVAGRRRSWERSEHSVLPDRERKRSKLKVDRGESHWSTSRAADGARCVDLL